MPLLNRLQDFRASVAEAESLIATAHQAGLGGAPLWSAADTRTITQAAFLKIFIAWEAFLEGALADYVMGEPSIAGNVMTKYASPLHADHAKKMIIGTQKYFDYSDPDRVRNMAKLY